MLQWLREEGCPDQHVMWWLDDDGDICALLLILIKSIWSKRAFSMEEVPLPASEPLHLTLIIWAATQLKQERRERG